MTDEAVSVSAEGRTANRWTSLADSRLLTPLLVLAITFAVYSATISYQFVYDDNGIIVTNPVVQSWRFVPRYFTEHVWGYAYPNVPGNYYRPVFLLFFLLNHWLFGIDPAGWHLMAVLSHLLVTFLVYLIGRRVTGDVVSAVVASLIFGVHPVHIEAVAWVSGVSEPLLAMLLLGSFLCYVRYRESEPKRLSWLAASLLLFALGALSKETAMLFPVMLVAYEWLLGPVEINTEEKAKAGRSLLRHAASGWRALIRVAPFFVVSLGYMVARTLVLKGFGHTVTPLSLATIVYTWPSLLWFYIRLLIWPVGLSGFYDTPYITHPTLVNFVLPLLAVLITGGALLWGAVRSRAVRFAVIWLVWPILPLFNLAVFPEGEIAHDRYMYLPSVGLAILIGLGVAWLRTRRPAIAIAGQPGWVVVAAFLIIALGAGTVLQEGQWKSNLSLYTHGVAIAPENNLALNNLANEVLERGDYDQAIELYQKVLLRKPNFWLATYNLGYAYYKVDLLEEAERYLTRAIQINTIDADQYLYLGLTRTKSGHLNEAASSIRKAIEIRRDGFGYHFALGAILKMQGDLSAALEEFRAELVNNPAQTAADQQIAEIEARLRK